MKTNQLQRLFKAVLLILVSAALCACSTTKLPTVAKQVKSAKAAQTTEGKSKSSKLANFFGGRIDDVSVVSKAPKTIASKPSQVNPRVSNSVRPKVRSAITITAQHVPVESSPLSDLLPPISLMPPLPGDLQVGQLVVPDSVPQVKQPAVTRQHTVYPQEAQADERVLGNMPIDPVPFGETEPLLSQKDQEPVIASKGGSEATLPVEKSIPAVKPPVPAQAVPGETSQQVPMTEPLLSDDPVIPPLFTESEIEELGKYQVVSWIRPRSELLSAGLLQSPVQTTLKPLPATPLPAPPRSNDEHVLGAKFYGLCLLVLALVLLIKKMVSDRW